VEKGVWKGRIRKNTNKKGLGSYHKSQEGILNHEKEEFTLCPKTRERKSRIL